jgi:hypothetical protein
MRAAVVRKQRLRAGDTGRRRCQKRVANEEIGCIARMMHNAGAGGTGTPPAVANAAKGVVRQ